MPANRKYPANVLDVHTHLFNARYLPLSSILRDAVGDWIANKLEAIVYRITDEPDLRMEQPPSPAFDGGEEEEGATDLFADRVHERLGTQLASTVALSPLAGASSFKALTSTVRADPLFLELEELQAVFEASGESPESPTLEEVDAALLDKADKSGARFGIAADATKLIAEAPLHFVAFGKSASLDVREAALGTVMRVSSLFRRALKWLIKKASALLEKAIAAGKIVWDAVHSVGVFIWQMLQAETKLLQRLKASYDPAQHVTHTMHLLMDMEHAYEPSDPAYYPYPKEQLERMAALKVQAGDGLIGFAAFDPRRKDWEDHFDLALRLGFTGFKFYPAMGYKPFGEGGEIGERIEKFFLKCVKDDIPIFTHCSPTGFEARKGWGLNAHPKWWREVLMSSPELGKLRLAFGHGGGLTDQNEGVHSAGWEANDDEWTDDDNFARHVAELCREFPNVYFGVGHFHELVKDPPTAARFEARWLTEYARPKPTDKGFLLEDKAMYGSDSHMIGIVNHTREFLHYFYDLFHSKPAELGRARFEKFAFGNGAGFLKIKSPSLSSLLPTIEPVSG